MRLAALIAVATLAAGAASASVDAAALRTSGDWRLSEVGGKIACTLTLTSQASFAGFELKAPLACRRAFPPLRAVAAWSLDDKGGIVLADAKAQPIVTFPAQAKEAQGKGPFETRAPDGHTWRLELVKPGAPDEPIKTAPAG
jgi:protease inhibitor Inh